MKYVLVFVHTTARYSCHAATCTAACNKAHQSLIPEQFDSIAEARAWANADETQKAGEPAKAIWRVCGCTKL